MRLMLTFPWLKPRATRDRPSGTKTPPPLRWLRPPRPDEPAIRACPSGTQIGTVLFAVAAIMAMATAPALWATEPVTVTLLRWPYT